MINFLLIFDLICLNVDMFLINIDFVLQMIIRVLTL